MRWIGTASATGRRRLPGYGRRIRAGTSPLRSGSCRRTGWISIQSQPTPLQATLEALAPDEAARIAEALKLIGRVGPEHAIEVLRGEAAKCVSSVSMTEEDSS
jgi:hypothetical protein